MLTLSPPRIPWHVQALTLDYLVDGFIDGSQATGSRPAPAPDPGTSAIVYGEQLVALIPGDEASLESAMQSNSALKFPTCAEIYVGSYLIRGTVLCFDTNGRVFQSYRGFPVRDAEISSRLPGAQWGGLKTPYLVVLSQHKQVVVLN